MPRGCEAIVVALAAALALLGPGCGGEAARERTREVEVGRHRLRLTPPETWEHLDHGRQQLFRNGEVELVLEDWGPVAREGLSAELLRAQQLWMAGRRRDAFARVRELHGTRLLLQLSEARAGFWKPWTDATCAPDRADSAAVGEAFDALLEGAGSLPELDPAQVTESVLSASHDADRREIARAEQRTIHGREWVFIETWDRVSHLSPRRTAWIEDRGHLLVLRTERGLIQQTGPAFERLLASIEVLPAK